MNKELLIEQLLEEKDRREKAEMELNRLQEIQVHAQKFESELTSWKSLLNLIPDVSCYDDIPKKYSQLQKYFFCPFFAFFLYVLHNLMHNYYSFEVNVVLIICHTSYLPFFFPFICFQRNN